MSDETVIIRNPETAASFPEKIGKYLITGILGKGGMGIVYKAFDPDISQDVALKVIRPELLKSDIDGSLLERFRNEVKACRRLKHDNIVATYDYHEEGYNCYIVMEFIAGESLTDFLKHRQPLEASTIHRIISQLLSALSYAHGKEVTHRDIKPDNIMIAEDASIHIMDFGIARMNASTLTVAGTILGSPGYMSPEQCEGEGVDNRSDLFSAGVVLYQLVTNEKPFAGENHMVTMNKIAKLDPVKVSSLNTKVPAAFDLIIDKALAKKTKNRYQSADAFLADIDKFYQSYSKSGRKRVLWVSSVAVTTLAVAGYVFNDLFVSDGGFIDSLSPVENSVIGTRPDADISAIKKVTAEDKLKALLAEFSTFDCNTLQLKLDPKKTFSISGTILPTDESRLKTVLESRLSGFKYSSTANALDKPFCDVLGLLNAAVERNQSTGGELDIQPYSHVTIYVEGELIKFEMIAPADNVFIYVDYFNADGSVVHLYPANDIENKVIQGPASLLIGDDAWEVSAPFGTDLITVISYPEALFDPLRPNWEQNAEEYLKALNKVLNALDKQQLVKADYFFLTTQLK